jgi:thiamine biosynthesis lipoprotein
MTMDRTYATFSAIGTSVFVAVRDLDELAHARQLAADVLNDVDEVYSRFRTDSDLSRVNAHSGEWVRVDPLLVGATEVAMAAASATGGLVNPLLGRHLVELGYDRDFSELIRGSGVEGGASHAAPADPNAWTRIELDPAGAMRIPAGTSLDLGATGKAWAADLIATAYEEHLESPAIVSVGGDLRIAQPDEEPWPVAIAERPGATPDAFVTLDRGGMATSSTQARRWTASGVDRHHLLDPRTGRPAPEVWRTVTATGSTCAAANAASTAAIVLGDEAAAWLAANGVTARLVAVDGSVETVGAWPIDPEGRAA